jgi:F-type H+-transporting ATPase subunit alpha
MEVLKQPQFSPYATEDQAAILFMSVNGYLMDVAVDKVAAFIKGYLEHLRIHHAAILESIAKTGATTPELEQEMKNTIENYKHVFQTTAGK